MQKLRELNSKRLTLAFAGLISVLLLLRDLGGINVPREVFVGIAAVICMFSDKSGIYCLMAFLTPVAQGVSYTYIAAIALVILLLKYRIKVHISGLLIMFTIMLIELFSAFRGLFNFTDYFRFIGVFFIVFLRMIDTDDGYDNLSIVKMYIAGYIVAMADIFGQMQKHYSWLDILKLKARIGNTRQLLNIDTEGMLLSFNPNTLGTLCTLAAVFCLLLYHKEKRPRYLVLFAAASLIGVTTQSRTFLVVYVLAIVLYICMSFSTIKTALKTIAGFAVGGSCLIFLVNRLLPSYIKGFCERFAAGDLSGGRIEIIQYYFSKWLQHIDRIILGVGLQNYQEKYGYSMSAHNAAQEVLITWGIPGLIMVIMLFLIVVRNARRLNPQALLIQYIPFFIFLVDLQTGQGFSNTSNILFFSVAYSAILMQLRGKLKTYDAFQKFISQDKYYT